MKTAEYSVNEMKNLLDTMSGMYDVARVVDPIECRLLEFGSDGSISIDRHCYGIWNAEHKCANCSSAAACRTGCHQEKAERFQDQIYHIQSNPVRLRLPDGGAYNAVVELVSIEKESESAVPANDRAAENVGQKAVQHRAFHDSLTDTLNAGAFYERARDAIMAEPHRAWVLASGNIMDFRLINTLFGVLKGNAVLIETAARLRRIAEEAGGLCGRLGGDQFTLLLPDEAYREASLLAAAQALTEAFSGGLFTFCIHFGVYRTADASIPISVMCDRANSALRTIRRDWRRTIAYFDDAIMRKSLFEQEIISGFDDALKSGQFRMYLQPLAREDGTIYGAEALTRWHRPDGSVVMPGDFIETLENAGAIHRLDMYIWERAVRLLREWKGTPRENLTISVNMSAKDFYSIDLYAVLTELVERYEVDSGKLKLEITETALLDDPEKTDGVISKLRGRGFHVVIDDFGTGYSSLSLLRDIRADALKIDMSFLHEMEHKQRSRIILESVIGMAASLGMDVVTEGVETETQLKTLAEMGCFHYQGYYFSRPVPAEEFERLLR